MIKISWKKYDKSVDDYVSESITINPDDCRFPDGTLALKLDALYIGESPIVSWHYESDAELLTLYCIARHLQYNHASLYMPYIPNARMDRVKDDEDVFTLKYFAEIINSMKFNAVHVMDAHSPVSLALIDGVIHTSATDFLISELIDQIDSDNLVLFFPDEGSLKRYAVDKPLDRTFGIKERDWKTGKITNLRIADEEIVKDKDILIIDDICSKGGTFYHSAKKLKELGANDIYLYATHLENSVNDGDLIKSDLFKKFYATNSMMPKVNDPRFKIVNISIED